MVLMSRHCWDRCVAGAFDASLARSSQAADQALFLDAVIAT